MIFIEVPSKICQSLPSSKKEFFIEVRFFVLNPCLLKIKVLGETEKIKRCLVARITIIKQKSGRKEYGEKSNLTTNIGRAVYLFSCM